MLDWSKVGAELSKPLDPKHVRPPRANGPRGDYVEAWYVQDTANDIFGHGEWRQELIETRLVAENETTLGRQQTPGWAVSYVCAVRITVGDTCREDWGSGHGYDRSRGLAHESAIKEAASDAMKRAFKSFGYRFGLALYDKTREHVAPDVSTLKTASAQGMRDAWEAGVLDSLPDDAPARDVAEAFAGQIIADFAKPATVAGLNNAWAKRQRHIDALDARQNDLYQNVLDAFQARMHAIETAKQEGAAE